MCKREGKKNDVYYGKAKYNKNVTYYESNYCIYKLISDWHTQMQSGSLIFTHDDLVHGGEWTSYTEFSLQTI